MGHSVRIEEKYRRRTDIFVNIIKKFLFNFLSEGQERISFMEQVTK